MKGRRILAAVFLLPALGSGYMTWLMWRAGDTGKWLFLVFALFFLFLTIAPILPELRPAPAPQPTPGTRFVPHWFMMLAVLVTAALILTALVGAVLRR
jgi:hypothetical protein